MGSLFYSMPKGTSSSSAKGKERAVSGRNTRARSWVFTWNNYTAEDISYLEKALGEGEYIFGEEVGEEGTPHLQGAVRFTNPRSFNSIRNLFRNNHVEMCKNWEASKNYCAKDGEVHTNIVAKAPKGKKKINPEGQALAEKLKAQVLEAYSGVVWKQWQREILDILAYPPPPRTINWYWDAEGGTGKSFLSKYVCCRFVTVLAEGKQSDCFNQVRDLIWEQVKVPHVVILDLPRHSQGYENYGLVEKLKNGFFYSGKYEGGICIYPDVHVFVFANFHPDLSKFSADRWNVVKIEPDSMQVESEGTGDLCAEEELRFDSDGELICSDNFFWD